MVKFFNQPSTQASRNVHLIIMKKIEETGSDNQQKKDYQTLLQELEKPNNSWYGKKEIITELINEGYIDDASKAFYQSVDDLKQYWLKNPNPNSRVGDAKDPSVVDLVELAKLLNLKDQNFYAFLKENIKQTQGNANEVLKYLTEVDEDPRVKEILKDMLDRDEITSTNAGNDYHSLVTASILSSSGEKNIFKQTFEKIKEDESRYHFLLDKFSEPEYLNDNSILKTIEEKAKDTEDWNILGKIAIYTKNYDLAKEAVINSLKIYKDDGAFMSSLDKKADDHAFSIHGDENLSTTKLLQSLKTKESRKQELLKSRPNLQKAVNIKSYLDLLNTNGLGRLALEIETLG